MKDFASTSIALAILFCIIFFPSSCLALPGKVVSITDGDTIQVRLNGKEKEIRLYGIDCPEIGQEHGHKAQGLTSTLVAGRNVEVKQMDTDQYGRVVGLVLVDGQSLNELIVRNGYAWVYRQYCQERFCSNWIKSETIAQRQKKGIWSSPVVIPPWEWRATKSENSNIPRAESAQPEIIIGEKPNTGSNESWWSKMGKALTPSKATKNETLKNEKRYTCDGRTHCSQMTSCQEATFFLRNCPGTKMDGNNDGVPCERQWCH